MRLRPDLEIASLTLPERVVRRQSFTVGVAVREVAGDTGAIAAVALYDGARELGSQSVEVGPGGSTEARFPVTLSEPGLHELRAQVSTSQPAESETDNNGRTATVEVALYDVDGAVVSQHHLATAIGIEVLRAGGNAFDAAVAVQFALNVVQPHTTGIGGGASIVARLADGTYVAIDARERAPADTDPRQYADRAVNRVSTSGFAVGVPGIPRAVDLMLEQWGTMSLAELLERPIDLAENGFPVGRLLAEATMEPRMPLFQAETRAVYLRPDGSPLQEGDWLVQPDLAKTFRLLAEHGASSVYSGEIAAAIIQAQLRHGDHGPGLRVRSQRCARQLQSQSAPWQPGAERSRPEQAA